MLNAEYLFIAFNYWTIKPILTPDWVSTLVQKWEVPQTTRSSSRKFACLFWPSRMMHQISQELSCLVKRILLLETETHLISLCTLGSAGVNNFRNISVLPTQEKPFPHDTTSSGDDCTTCWFFPQPCWLPRKVHQLPCFGVFIK